jgi:hypothetical protein
MIMKVTDEMVMAATMTHIAHANDLAFSRIQISDSMKLAIEAAIQSVWVSVGDRLPDQYRSVLPYRPQTSRGCWL